MPNGSPPRAWGQLHHARLDHARLEPYRQRFTPTRVGTTSPFAWSRSAFAVHPHARGDNKSVCLVQARFCGSPPRAWGQLVVSVDQPHQHRFTPTRVGTTTQRKEISLRSPVHPHARGDNFLSSISERHATGSPPRAWGQHRRGEPRPPRRPVHPHARGDNAG